MKTNLIFLHAFPFNASQWQPQLQFFKANYEVWTPDLRGHARGPNGPGPWMIADFANDLKQFMQTHKIEKAIICGLSIGGYIALNFIKNNPEMVSALVLCDTRADADTNEAKQKRHATIQKLHQEGLNQFAGEFVKNAVSETSYQKPDLVQNLVQMIKESKSDNLALAVGALASREDNTDSLKQIKVPCLVMVGQEDKLTPPELSQKMAAEISGAKLVVIENAGHLSNIEQPDIFNQHLEQFLKQHANL